MKKALLFAVSIVLVTLVFSGCKDDVTTIDSLRVGQVATVTVTQTDFDDNFIVSWDAVDGADGYTVYGKIDGEKTVKYLASGQPNVIYNTDGSPPEDNQNFDNWSAWIDIPSSITVDAGTKLIVGVQTNGLIYADSDIKWAADPVTKK
jgi:hypothetical protein